MQQRREERSDLEHALVNTKFEAVLFDLGGVFTDSPFAAARGLGNELGADPLRVMEVIFGPYHRDTNHPWHRLERGELSLDAARTEIIAIGAREGIEIDPFDVLMRLSGGGEAREPMVACVRSLRAAGYRTAIVTNNAREFRDAWWTMLPFDELFDAIVDSCEIGVRKPDRRIYERALSLIGEVRADRAVFLDDFEANVRAAEELGMHGIVVDEDPSEAIAELRALLLGERT